MRKVVTAWCSILFLVCLLLVTGCGSKDTAKKETSHSSPKTSKGALIATQGSLRAEILGIKTKEPFSSTEKPAKHSIRIIDQDKTVLTDKLIRQDNKNDSVIVESLKIEDLDGSGGPEIITSFNDNGPYCCTQSNIYYLQGSKYKRLTHNWGPYTSSPKLSDADTDGQLEFVGSDSRFDGEFIAHACGQEPAQVWRFKAGKLSDVTRNYPEVIKEQSDKLYQEYRKYREKRDECGVTGSVIPWVASEYLLSQKQGDTAWQQLEKAVRAGELDTTVAPGKKQSNAAFLKRVNSFLVKTGYITKS